MARVPLAFLYGAFFLFFLLALILYRLSKLSLLMGLLSACALFSIGYSLWILPLEGVIIRSTYLYQSPSKLSPKVASHPLPSGIKIEVIGADLDGKWLKVKDQESNIGYIFYDSLMVIS